MEAVTCLVTAGNLLELKEAHLFANISLSPSWVATTVSEHTRWSIVLIQNDSRTKAKWLSQAAVAQMVKVHIAAHSIPGLSPINGWKKYMDQKGSAAMLTIKKSAGVTPEVDLRINCIQAMKINNHEIHPGFEMQGRHHQNSKTGYQQPHETDFYPPFFSKKDAVDTICGFFHWQVFIPYHMACLNSWMYSCNCVLIV